MVEAAHMAIMDLDRGTDDRRFRALVGEAAWARLPAPVRRRFSKRLGPGGKAVYAGEVREMRTNFAGRMVCRLARVIGGPLPLVFDAPAPSVVTVTESADGSQTWTRLYARRLGFPQIVHSSKRFEGATGLEEHVGGGVGMSLAVTVEGGVLVFRSVRYFIAVGARRLTLPRVLEPGRITVSHQEIGGGCFSFTLEIRHPRLGLLVRQHAVFQEDIP